MAHVVSLLFLCLSFDHFLGKIVYVSDYSTWTDAQIYCRTHHTDLAFISSRSDTENIIKAAGDANPKGWVGLYRDPEDTEKWLWSGGGSVTYQNWKSSQPDNYGNIESVANIESNGQWNDIYDHYLLPFYCVDLGLSRMKMSWEMALEDCKQNNSDLSGFSSDNEFLLAMQVLPPDNNGHMWVNLRFLGGRWLTVDGGLVQEQVWHNGGSLDPCPVRNRCAVISKDGELKSWDCQDQLYFMCK